MCVILPVKPEQCRRIDPGKRRREAQEQGRRHLQLPPSGRRDDLDPTVNYKDAMALSGRSPVIRQFPLIPGIDFAGVVEASTYPDLVAGDRVLATG